MLITSGLLSRVLAQTEIVFSNSMIESWWRVLKHQWLFLNTLDTVRSVEKLVAFYVQRSTICVFRTPRFGGRRRTKCT
jgi:putative transposase